VPQSLPTAISGPDYLGHLGEVTIRVMMLEWLSAPAFQFVVCPDPLATAPGEVSNEI